MKSLVMTFTVLISLVLLGCGGSSGPNLSEIAGTYTLEGTGQATYVYDDERPDQEYDYDIDFHIAITAEVAFWHNGEKCKNVSYNGSVLRMSDSNSESYISEICGLRVTTETIELLLYITPGATTGEFHIKETDRTESDLCVDNIGTHLGTGIFIKM